MQICLHVAALCFQPIEEKKPPAQELTYEAVQNPDGTVSIRSNMNVLEWAERRAKKKRRGR
jgi:hypothetical protein